MLRFICVIGLSLCAVNASRGVDHAEAPPPRLIPIAQLVSQLGSKDVQERDSATERLSRLMVEPPIELLAATKSENSEVATRAKRAVAGIRDRRADRVLDRGRRFAEQGKVDLFVAATAAWDLEADDPRLWGPAHALGRRLIENAKLTGDRKPHNCPSSYKDFATYRGQCNPQFTRSNLPFIQPDSLKLTPPVFFFNRAIQAPGVEALEGGLFGGLIISRGPVQSTFGFSTSVIFANGDVSSVGNMLDSIIVSDGNVEVAKMHAARALVIARGNITIKGGANPTYMAAGGKVSLGEKAKETRSRYNEIHEHATNPLGISFFELSTVGVEVKSNNNIVTVTSVADGKPFAQGQIKIGDVITAINGKKPESAESLRRLLRDALALGDASVSLRRGDQHLDIRIALPE